MWLIFVLALAVLMLPEWTAALVALVHRARRSSRSRGASRPGRHTAPGDPPDPADPHPADSPAEATERAAVARLLSGDLDRGTYRDRMALLAEADDALHPLRLPRGQNNPPESSA